MAETGITRRYNVRVPLRDGITLAADLVRPAGRPAPAVVLRTPYGRSGERQSARAEAFARRGYAYVLVDVRGRGDSDGSFVPYRNDGPDGADVIDWVAAQDWCDGKVATHGGSYPGRIQWLTALHRPAALKAMVCLVTPSDPFVEWPTGVPDPMSVHWFRMTDGRAIQYTGDTDWMSVYAHRPLLTMDEAAGFVSPNWREEVRHTTLDEWWEPVRYQHRIGELDLPVLHVSGWYDDEQIGTPANFAAMTAAGRAGQRLLMGPWGHAVNTTRKLGEIDFGPDALIDLDAYMLAFLDEHVRGIAPEPAPEPVRIFVMGAGQWRDEATWPPASAGTHVFHLASGGRANSRFGDGRLQAEPPVADQAPDEWVHDPDRPVPFITGRAAARSAGRTTTGGREPRRRAGVQHRATGRAGRADRAGHAGGARGRLGGRHRHHGQAGRRASERVRPAALRRHGTAALPARVRPLVIHTQTGTEYWVRRGSLAHTDTQGNDLKQPDTVRVQCWASSQHFADPLPRAPSRGIGQNYSNIVSTSMFFRANLDAMDRWATDGTTPPPSRIPTRADGTLVSIDEWRRQFPAIPGIATPRAPNALPLLDFGPDVERGILKEPPDVVAGRQYTVLVPAVDRDGNDMPGVRAPMVAAPLGTYTGWNPRARGHGHGAQLRFEGSYIPFPESPQEREATGDPRLSILERYPDKAAYVAAITTAARELVAQGLMLEEDVERCAAAAANWGRPRHDVSLE